MSTASVNVYMEHQIGVWSVKNKKIQWARKKKEKKSWLIWNLCHKELWLFWEQMGPTLY